MKTIQKFLMTCGLSAAILPTMAADCFGDGRTAVECDTDEDCAGEEENTVCDGGDETTADVLEGTCVAPDGGEGEGEGEGDTGVTCTGDIGASECLEGRDTAELPDPFLCDGDICVEPDSLVGACAGAGKFAAYAGGPVIIDAELITKNTTATNCTSNTNSYITKVYSEEAFDTSLYTQRLKFAVDGSATPGLTYSDGADLAPAATELGADFPGYYTLEFYLCGDGLPDGAIALTSNTGAQGSAFCLDQATGP